MKTKTNILKRLTTRLFSVIQKSDRNMEEIIKDIFYKSVNSVKPCELITKNKLLTIRKENNREFVDIKNKDELRKFEITNKRIHLGE